MRPKGRNNRRLRAIASPASEFKTTSTPPPLARITSSANASERVRTRLAKEAGANGFHGFETAVAVILGLGLNGRVVYRACVSRPREIVGQSLEDEWILIDPNEEWIVDASSFKSRGKNTPFQGRRLRGRVIMTVCRGQVVTERVMQHA